MILLLLVLVVGELFIMARAIPRPERRIKPTAAFRVNLKTQIIQISRNIYANN
jgi:hypothetical protein